VSGWQIPNGMLGSGMPPSTVDTRTRIMDEAQALILDRGYSATSVGAIVEQADLTKGAFFHHFDAKADLARALVERWAEHDLAHLDAALARSDRLARDPVQRLLVFVGLLEEAWEGLTEPYAGCLFVSYVAEAGLFDEGTHAVIRDTLLRWRTEVHGLLQAAADARPPSVEVDLEATADLLVVAFEGSFVVSRALGEADLVARQIRQYRTYLEGLFGG